MMGAPHAFAHMSYQLRTRERAFYAGIGKRSYNQQQWGQRATGDSVALVTAPNNLVPACGDSRAFRVYAFVYAF